MFAAWLQWHKGTTTIQLILEKYKDEIFFVLLFNFILALCLSLHFKALSTRGTVSVWQLREIKIEKNVPASICFTLESTTALRQKWRLMRAGYNEPRSAICSRKNIFNWRLSTPDAICLPQQVPPVPQASLNPKARKNSPTPKSPKLTAEDKHVTKCGPT